jgi:hypothetical protein
MLMAMLEMAACAREIRNQEGSVDSCFAFLDLNRNLQAGPNVARVNYRSVRL